MRNLRIGKIQDVKAGNEKRMLGVILFFIFEIFQNVQP